MMNFKKIMLTLVFVLTVFTASAYAKTMEFTMGDTKVNLKDGEVIESYVVETAPYTVNDRTMVPVRIVSEKFEAKVDWVPADNKVVITKGDNIISLILGSDKATVNGKEVKLDVAPVETNGRTLVPLRFVSETLEYDVTYVEPTEQIIITNDPAVATVNGLKISKEVFSFAYKHLYATYSKVLTPEQIAEYTLDTLRMYYSVYSEAKKFGMALGQQDFATLNEMLLDEKDFSFPVLRSVYIDYMVKYYMTMCMHDYAVMLIEAEGFSDEYVNTYYAENYMAAKHILISYDTENAEKKARDILAKVNRGIDFDKLMIEQSQDQGHLLYPDGYVFKRGEMVDEFYNATSKLKVNQVSGLVKSPYGYHIIKKLALPEITDEYKETIINNAVLESAGGYLQRISDCAEYKANYTVAQLINLI